MTAQSQVHSRRAQAPSQKAGLRFQHWEPPKPGTKLLYFQGLLSGRQRSVVLFLGKLSLILGGLRGREQCALSSWVFVVTLFPVNFAGWSQGQWGLQIYPSCKARWWCTGHRSHSMHINRCFCLLIASCLGRMGEESKELYFHGIRCILPLLVLQV